MKKMIAKGILTILLGLILVSCKNEELPDRGFLNGNTLHSEIGDIHYSSYIPEEYDGSRPYALFITLPGWEGLYFQGVGANMVEDFGTEAVRYNEEMIVLSAQLDDWGRRQQTILLP